MTDIHTTKHFVRINGKVLGPFDAAQLQSLKERGRLRGEHELSANRKNWVPASEVTGLFKEMPASTVGSPFIPTEDNAEPQQNGDWYYTTNGEQHGPVSFNRLKTLVNQGVLTEEDLIWHSTLSEWIPVREKAGLYTRRNIRQTTTRSKMSKDPMDSHTLLWSLLLDQLRDLMTLNQLRSFLRTLVSIGGAAMLIAIGFAFLTHLTMAIKGNTLSPALAGAGIILIASAMRFAAIHSLYAGEEMIFNSPQQVSSSTFIKVTAVLLLTVGVIQSAILLIAAIDSWDISQKIPLLMVASGLLFVFVFGAAFILHPEGMNISRVPGSQAGCEGVAILSFLLKSAMRLCNFLFIAAAVLACANYGIASYLVTFQRERIEMPRELSIDHTINSLITSGLSCMVIAGMAPLATYVSLALGSIFLDMFQTILQLPKASPIAANSAPQRPVDGSDYE